MALVVSVLIPGEDELATSLVPILGILGVMIAGFCGVMVIFLKVL